MVQARFSVQDCHGYTLWTMELKASNAQVVERIIICVEIGSVSCNKCDRYRRLEGVGHRSSPVGLYTFMQQSTQVSGKVSFVFCIKVYNDPDTPQP